MDMPSPARDWSLVTRGTKDMGRKTVVAGGQREGSPTGWTLSRKRLRAWTEPVISACETGITVGEYVRYGATIPQALW